MNKIVGIQFKNHGQVYDFDSGHFVLKKSDKVLVITREGPAIGEVYREPRSPTEGMPQRPLKKIFRLATVEEIEKYEKSREMENRIFEYCYQKIKEKNLPMSLVSVDRRFDGSKIVVYFSADGRVDFRDLVRDLVAEFHVRIEMRQIGVRHQAKMVGGMGSCGRIICCAGCLNQFAPVTIKMAKEQNVSLNPSKISGMCGRLMCCLNYEYETYEHLKKSLPKLGKRVGTRLGEGKVVRQNVLRGTVNVALEKGNEIEVRADEVDQGRLFRKKKKKK